jgi:hypothetical protein
MEKPDIDSIDGLSPAISIDQKSTSHNPRSTVGTVTEIHDYLRLLYARCGIPHCPDCGKVIERQSIDQVVDRVLNLPEGTKAQIIAPCVRGRKGEHQKLLDELKREGYVRVRVDGTVYDLADVPALDKKFKHNIDAVIDRVVIKQGIEGRLTDSLETAFRLGNGLAIVAIVDGEELLFSQNYACPDCGTSIEELAPRMFSFNNPFGACPTCTGLGTLLKIDPDLVIPDRTLSLAQGCVNVMGWNSGSKGTIASMYFEALTAHYGASMKTPFQDLPEEVQNAVLYGTGKDKLHIAYRKEFGSGSFDAPFEGIVIHKRVQQAGNRAVHDPYALPGLQGQAPQAREPRRNGGGNEYCRPLRPAGQGSADVPLVPAAEQDPYAHCGANSQGNRRAAGLSGQRWPRLSDAFPLGGVAQRRRSAAHPAGNADRQRADGRSVHSRRAEYRPASAGQRASARYPKDHARSREYPDCGGTRRRNDKKRRLCGGYRPWRG